MSEMTPELVGEHVHVDGDQPCSGCGWHTGPVLLWEGQAALFASPDGGRVIRYDDADGTERFVGIPAELVPAMEMLRANPAALVAISQSAVGGVARRMVSQLTRKAEAAANGAQ